MLGSGSYVVSGRQEQVSTGGLTVEKDDDELLLDSAFRAEASSRLPSIHTGVSFRRRVK